MSGVHPERNLLLRRLAAAERHRLYPHLELVELSPDAVLHESGQLISHAYFPISSIISVLYELQEGESLEFEVVGDEGFLGITLLLGGRTSPRRAIVHTGGHAYRLPASALVEEFSRAGNLHDLFLRYTQAVITQTSQAVVCNRHHSVEQQLCRWLLTFLDRVRTGRVTITHRRIARLLAVRRESVTLAARRLQQLGVISCHRGEIVVLDRPRLERLSCECYGVVRMEWRRLLQVDPFPADVAGEAWYYRAAAPSEARRR